MLSGVIFRLEEVLFRIVAFTRLKLAHGNRIRTAKRIGRTSACQSDSVSKAMKASTLSVNLGFCQTYFIQTSRNLVLAGEHLATQISR